MISKYIVLEMILFFLLGFTIPFVQKPLQTFSLRKKLCKISETKQFQRTQTRPLNLSL